MSMKYYTFSDVLIKPKYSEILSRSNVNLSVDLKNSNNLTLPIISANMKTITGVNMTWKMHQQGGMGILHRFNTIEEAISDYNQIANSKICGVSIGVQEEDKERFDKLYQAGARIFCIDVAHGHHILVKNMTKWIKAKQLNDITLITGNIATGDGAYDLVDWGADVVKVGIGPGSVCTTRQRTGVGVPQLSALDEVYNVLKGQGKIDIKIIADGGITSVGDIAKALKFADFVMIGSMFAGTSETPGHVYKNPEGQFYKVYGGSASGENKGENKFVEGMMKTIPFKGKVKYILREIREGVQSAFSYVGASNMAEYKERCEFQFITGGSSRESKF